MSHCINLLKSFGGCPYHQLGWIRCAINEELLVRMMENCCWYVSQTSLVEDLRQAQSQQTTAQCYGWVHHYLPRVAGWYRYGKDTYR
jgi:hypothetical protein